MSSPNQPSNTPYGAAKEFWTRWFSDISFGQGIEDPLGHVYGVLRNEYNAPAVSALLLAQESFETVLTVEQMHQRLGVMQELVEITE